MDTSQPPPDSLPESSPPPASAPRVRQDWRIILMLMLLALGAAVLLVLLSVWAR
ncbi:hypothetical protein HQ590_04400 [bacterium]|nr:hypothetical protein [bacterium]